MTRSESVHSASRTTRAEDVVQIIIMLAIGSAAAAASFTHVHNVAAAHGQDGWLAWADAVVLELMSIASGLELRRRKRQHKSVRFPAAVMGCAVALSISAQVVEAEFSVIGWLAAALPALGFLVMVKIAIGRAASVQADRTVEARPDMVTRADDNQDRRESDPPESARAVDPVEFADVTHLLPAARAAHQTLIRQGQALTHKALTRCLRADGHAVSNARAATLLKILRNHSSDYADRPANVVPIDRDASKSGAPLII